MRIGLLIKFVSLVKMRVQSFRRKKHFSLMRKSYETRKTSTSFGLGFCLTPVETDICFLIYKPALK